MGTERDELLRRVDESHEKAQEDVLVPYGGKEEDFEPPPYGAYGEPEEEPEPKKAEEPEEVKAAPEPEPEPEPVPEPEAKTPEPEPEPETPAEEVLVVDQQERRVPRSELLEIGRSVTGPEADEDAALAIGKRVLQRELAAENRLQDSAKLRSELREMRAELAQQKESVEKQQPPDPTVDELEGELDALDERIADADYEERPQLRKERTEKRRELMRAINREDRATERQAAEQTEIRQAEERLRTAVSEKHPDWPTTIGDQRFQEWLDTNRGGMYRAVIGGARTTDGQQVPPGTLDPAWVIPIFDEWQAQSQGVAADILARRERKEAIDTPPAASRSARPKKEPEPETDEDYVAGLAARRRRGGYAQGENY